MTDVAAKLALKAANHPAGKGLTTRPSSAPVELMLDKDSSAHVELMLDKDNVRPEFLEACNHVLWYVNGGGYQPGSFTLALIGAFLKADHINFGKLKNEFPVLGTVLHHYKNVDGGYDDIVWVANLR